MAVRAVQGRAVHGDNFGRKSEFTVSVECTNIFNARLYDNFKMQKPGRAFAVKFGYNFIK